MQAGARAQRPDLGRLGSREPDDTGRLLAGQLGLPFSTPHGDRGRRLPGPQIFARPTTSRASVPEHETIAGLLGGPDRSTRARRRRARARRTAACCSAVRGVPARRRTRARWRRVGGDAGRPMLRRPGLAAVYQRGLAAYEAVATHTVPTDGREPAGVCRDIVLALGAAVPRRTG